MSTPSSTELEQNLAPLERLYVKTLIAEAMAEHAKEHEQLVESLNIRLRAMNEALAEERAHINKLEQLLNMAPNSRRRLGELIDAINRIVGQ